MPIGGSEPNDPICEKNHEGTSNYLGGDFKRKCQLCLLLNVLKEARKRRSYNYNSARPTLLAEAIRKYDRATGEIK